MKKSKRMARGVARFATSLALVLLAGCYPLPHEMRIPEVLPPSPDAGPEATAPGALAPPSGNQVALVLVGSGTQNYQCRSTGEAYQWAPIGPDARLFGAGDKLVGKHYAGPTWELFDGSKAVGKVVAQVPSLQLDSVPQLLLKAESSGGAGALAGVTYVQRLRSIGGVAPASGCDASTTGGERQILYSAHYVFFKPS